MTVCLVARPITAVKWTGVTSYFADVGQRDGRGGELGGGTLTRDTGLKAYSGRVQCKLVLQNMQQ